MDSTIQHLCRGTKSLPNTQPGFPTMKDIFTQGWRVLLALPFITFMLVATGCQSETLQGEENAVLTHAPAVPAAITRNYP
jgi:hypothetical protein